jgi:ABC-type glycerol-3-phosphate transport system permease component
MICLIRLILVILKLKPNDINIINHGSVKDNRNFTKLKKVLNTEGSILDFFLNSLIMTAKMIILS